MSWCVLMDQFIISPSSSAWWEEEGLIMANTESIFSYIYYFTRHMQLSKHKSWKKIVFWNMVKRKWYLCFQKWWGTTRDVEWSLYWDVCNGCIWVQVQASLIFQFSVYLKPVQDERSWRELRHWVERDETHEEERVGRQKKAFIPTRTWVLEEQAEV